MYRSQRRALSLESLDARLVPSATVLDLTTAGAEATAQAARSSSRPTPSRPAPGTSGRSSASRARPPAAGPSRATTPTPGRSSSTRTRARSSPGRSRSAQVPRVVVDGVAYREFLLDINQKSSSSAAVARRGADLPRRRREPDRVRCGRDARRAGRRCSTWTPDGDVSVLLDARLNSGSGSGDMTAARPELGVRRDRTRTASSTSTRSSAGWPGPAPTAGSRSGP